MGTGMEGEAFGSHEAPTLKEEVQKSFEAENLWRISWLERSIPESKDENIQVDAVFVLRMTEHAQWPVVSHKEAIQKSYHAGLG
ncbi:hypothetical protein V6N13_072812 [Hibiscus sabdariffa]|uniref:Uncharacterized protein n=1 Tax=Hibiscus sabdariffa TaxID=183260 RepID=A0ABR2E7S0_9ROSI